MTATRNGKVWRCGCRALLFCALVFVPVIVLGDEAAVEGSEWALMAVNVCGGLALFLFGMERMTDAFKAAAGGRLQTVLARLTKNRFGGACVGALVTMVIQSSSVTTVLVVGFVSAGIMTLSQSIGVIMGANIGTTITAQIIAFKITHSALFLVAAGFVLLFVGKSEAVRFYGEILFGLGLVFLGMTVVNDALVPLRTHQPFLDLMVRMERPLPGVLVGAAFTALIQSSSAATAIVIVLAGQGFLSLEAGIALALGANVGTCITAMLAAIGKPREALRAAAVHVLFNCAGVALWLGLIDVLAGIAIDLSPSYPELTGIVRIAEETPRQIANANTFFNLANTLIFIGFAPLFGWVVTRLFPDRPPAAGQPIISPRFLDEYLLETPSAALNMVRMEIGQLGYHVLLMMAVATTALQKQSAELFREIEKADDSADILHAAILKYLSLVGKRSLTASQAADYFRLTQAADTLEGIGDILESDVSRLGLKMLQTDSRPSGVTLKILDELSRNVALTLRFAVTAVVENDQLAAQEVLALRGAVDDGVQKAFRQQVKSLARSDLRRLKTLQLEFEMTDRLKQIYSLNKRIARLYVPPEV